MAEEVKRTPYQDSEDEEQQSWNGEADTIDNREIKSKQSKEELDFMDEEDDFEQEDEI